MVSNALWDIDHSASQTDTVRNINEDLRRTCTDLRDIYDAALLDGCNPAMALDVARGIDTGVSPILQTRAVSAKLQSMICC
jgi:hypothetical protein